MPPVGIEPKISAGERPQAAHLLRSWVRIPPGAWIFVCCECRVLSGRGLCDEVITRPEEFYRLWCVVVCDLETSRIGAPCIYDISSLGVKEELDPRRVHKEWLLRPCFTLWPRQRYPATLWFWASMVFLCGESTISVLAYSDVMRRTWWKVQQDKNRMQLVGNCLEVF